MLAVEMQVDEMKRTPSGVYAFLSTKDGKGGWLKLYLSADDELLEFDRLYQVQVMEVGE